MGIKKLVAWFISILIVFSSGYSFGAIFDVKNTNELKHALYISERNGESDTIKVYQGFYKGPFQYWTDQTDLIQIMGGYNSNGEKINDPSKTILDGQYNGCTLHVVGGGHIWIEGLTIQNGKSNDSRPGGLLAASIKEEGQAGNVLLMNNIIKNNSTENYGGGVHAESWAPNGTSGGVTLLGNTIMKNTAKYGGGGANIYVLSGSGETTGRISVGVNEIVDNEAELDGGGVMIWSRADSGPAGEILVYTNTILGNEGSDGGGVFIESESTTGTAEGIYINSNTVMGNIARSNGGGIYTLSRSTSGTAAEITFENNTFSNNIASSGGGAYARSFPDNPGNIYILDNIFSENSADRTSGGLQVGSEAEVILVNNMITKNRSNYWYGGALASGNVTMVNNTISYNQTEDRGGGVGLGVDIYADVYNNIIWGNTATEAGDIVLYGPCSLIAGYNNNYSDILGVWTSEGNNIDQNPLFVGGDDYHLQAASPCRDAGTDSAPNLPTTDIDGQNRIIGDFPDIGADEIGGLAFLRYLVQVLVHYDLPGGFSNSMISTINNARKSFEKQNYKAAINQMKALNNHVRAQSGKKLTETQAREIISLSNETMVALDDDR